MIPSRGVEAVHLGQDLVQRLLALVVTAERRAAAARAADGVQLVDEDDRGRGLAGLLEQIAHARRADADDHLDELRSAEAEERDARLPGDRARQQRLAGSRRTDQQHALRHRAAEPLVLRGVLQEVDDLDQLVLGFVDAGDVVEGDLRLFLAVALGATATEPEHAGAAGRSGAATDPDERADQQQRRTEADQQLEATTRPSSSRALIDDALLLEQRLETRVGEGRSLRHEVLGGVGRVRVGGEPRGQLRRRRRRRLRVPCGIGDLGLERAADRIPEADDFLDVPRRDLLLEERVRDGDRRRFGKAGAHQQEVGRHDDHDDHPPRLRPNVRPARPRLIRVLRRRTRVLIRLLHHRPRDWKEPSE